MIDISNVVQLFKFQEKEVNVIEDNGEVWFKAKDVCDAIDLSNVSMALKLLEVDERSKFNLGRQDETNFISESGLYHLLNGSRKKQAKPFQRWVNHEVLPSIRKHGAYMTPETIEKIMLTPDYIIKLATTLKNEQEARKKAESELEKKVGIIVEQKPFVDFAKSVQISENNISVKDLAGLLSNNVIKIGRNYLFE